MNKPPASEQISSSIEEMASSVNQNAENAQQTERYATSAAQNIKTANDSVVETIIAMKNHYSENFHYKRDC